MTAGPAASSEHRDWLPDGGGSSSLVVGCLWQLVSIVDQCSGSNAFSAATAEPLSWMTEWGEAVASVAILAAAAAAREIGME